MKYLLDTNVLIAMFRNEHGIRQAILDASTKECVISELTYGELLVGAYKGGNIKQQREVEYAAAMFQLLPVSQNIIKRWAETRAELEQRGMKIDTIDCLLASTAMEHNLTVVTHNTKHFERISNLAVLDWEK